MKTKTNSFTKFINFCVLALFFISTLIFFTSCDNGNSPNDNINQQQNNNSQTDYCEICDGLQTENCGIKHKCDDENCVEYSDNRIYKNGHTHDYCEKTDCDGSTHKGQAHPTEPTYPDWCEEKPIGGEGSLYEVYVINDSAYNEETGFVNNGSADVERKVNDYLDKYIEHINGLTLNKELTGEIEIPTTAIKNMAGDNAEWRFDALIGTTLKDEISTNTIGINDVCKLALETITKNIGISGNNALDKAKFKYYCWAIENYIYDITSNGCNKTQSETEKNGPNGIIESWEGAHINRGIDIPFNLYITENGATSLNPQIFDEMDKMVNAAVERFKTQSISVTKEDIYNILNLSFTASSIEGMHDYLSSTLLVNEHTHTDSCYNNEMVDAIGGVKLADMVAKITPTKLNKLNFSHDYGRELV